jgi:hypothetical protein
VKPATDLSRLEEVLVVTGKEETAPVADLAGPGRAVDILAERLPSVPDKPATDPGKASPTPGTTAPNATGLTKPDAAGSVAGKPPGIKTAGQSKPVGNSPAAAKLPASGLESASKPAANSASTAKPAGAQGVVKPATTQKPTPAPVGVSEKDVKPAGLHAQQPAPRPADPPPAGEQPQ